MSSLRDYKDVRELLGSYEKSTCKHCKEEFYKKTMVTRHLCRKCKRKANIKSYKEAMEGASDRYAKGLSESFR